ncbi:MAG: branched-chain amino acid ABC transporter permease, partial [Nitrososphaeria archaeon]|nr:branched-chain amino acid ABC transporter permease [Nitrososphaeria archaeon]
MILSQEITRVLVLGAIRSGTLSLLALGFTLIYGISGVVNLSYGSFFMFSTYLFYVLGYYGLLSSIP